MQGLILSCMILHLHRPVVGDVLAYVTATEKEHGTKRLFFSTIFQNTESVCMMRRTFLTSALDMREIMSYIYSKSWKLQFRASSSIIIIEDYYLQTFLHSL